MYWPLVNSSSLTDIWGSVPSTLLLVMGMEWPDARQATSLWDHGKCVAGIAGWASRGAEIDKALFCKSCLGLVPLLLLELCSFSEVRLILLDSVFDKGPVGGMGFISKPLLLHKCSYYSYQCKPAHHCCFFKHTCRTLLTHSPYA